MRRFIGWMAGLAGIAALVKLLHRRPRPLPPAEPTTADDPAEALRRKLAEARASATSPTEEPAPAATTAPDVASEPDAGEDDGPSIEERRADVHARAQAAIDSMRVEGE